MAWCPNCKNEYREGITHCSDCDVELVEELPIEVEQPEIPEEILQQIAMAEMAKNNAEDEDSDEDSNEESADEKELYRKLRTAKSTVYVKNQDKYNDFKFSGYSFIGFAVLGFAFIILNAIGILDLMNTFSLIVMSILFLIFAIIGVHSLLSAKKIKGSISEETTAVEQIKAWMEENFTEEYYRAIATEDSEENQYFAYSEQMNKDLLEQFTDTDITLLDELADEFLNHYLDN